MAAICPGADGSPSANSGRLVPPQDLRYLASAGGRPAQGANGVQLRAINSATIAGAAAAAAAIAAARTPPPT
jgi:hypothetical protein